MRSVPPLSRPHSPPAGPGFLSGRQHRVKGFETLGESPGGGAAGMQAQWHQHPITLGGCSGSPQLKGRATFSQQPLCVPQAGPGGDRKVPLAQDSTPLACCVAFGSPHTLSGCLALLAVRWPPRPDLPLHVPCSSAPAQCHPGREPEIPAEDRAPSLPGVSAQVPTEARDMVASVRGSPGSEQLAHSRPGKLPEEGTSPCSALDSSTAPVPGGDTEAGHRGLLRSHGSEQVSGGVPAWASEGPPCSTPCSASWGRARSLVPRLTLKPQQSSCERLLHTRLRAEPCRR